MNVKVKQIIVSLLKRAEITASWGISNIRITSNSVTFSVEAIKYEGDIMIKATYERNCIVTFKDGTNIPCQYDALTEVIDTKIEYCENYIEEIMKWLYNANK